MKLKNAGLAAQRVVAEISTLHQSYVVILTVLYSHVIIFQSVEFL